MQKPIGSLIALVLACATPLAAQSPSPSFDWNLLQEEGSQRLSEYLRINTSNPPGNELETARWLQQVLAREGIESQILDTTELGAGRANFYARLKGDGSRKAIALVHHMDVVPVSRELWHQDPFGGLIRNGEIWGRGALDMKGHGIVQLMALIAIKRAGIHLTRDLVFIGNADEESGGIGATAMVEKHADLLRDVEYLLTEGADTRVENGKVLWFGIDVGEKRPLWTRMVVHGVASHGSVPAGDRNPVPRLARAIARVSAWETPIRMSPAVERFFKAQAPYQSGAGRRYLANPREALKTAAGRNYLTSDPARNALLRNTISPTVLSGSNKTNTIPEYASAELDIRLLPDEDPDAFRQELTRVIGDSLVKLEEIYPITPRYDAPLGTELFKAIERVAGEMLPGIPVATPVSAGATDRPTYARAGIIAYGVDPYLIPDEHNRDQVHGNDERISQKNLGWGIRFYVTLLRQMAQ